jgi:cephalosporin-C deacetylase-like acetyl esterase
MKRILSLLFALFAVADLSAARIDTVAVFSPKMERKIEALVVVPEAEAAQAMPVLYLLHGYGGDHTAWQ